MGQHKQHELQWESHLQDNKGKRLCEECEIDDFPIKCSCGGRVHAVRGPDGIDLRCDDGCHVDRESNPDAFDILDRLEEEEEDEGDE